MTNHKPYLNILYSALFCLVETMLTRGIEDETQIIQDDIKKYNIERKYFSSLQNLKLLIRTDGF